MEDDQRATANQLFAIATAMIEDMIETAAAGQSTRLTPSQLAEHGQLLQAAARDLVIVAGAASIIAKSIK